MPVNTRIQVRRGTASVGSNQWTDQILYAGEIGYETDTGRFKIGDGTTAWSSLTYASVLPNSFTAGSGIAITQGTNGSALTISLSDPSIQAADVTDFSEAVDDRVAALLNGPAGSGVVFNYDDANNRLDVSLDSTVVRTSGTQTISGVKTFVNNTTFNNRIQIAPTGTTSAEASFLSAGYGSDTYFFARAPWNGYEGYFQAGIQIDGTNAPFRVSLPSNNTTAIITHGIWGADTIDVNKGGTGRTSYSNGQLLIGSGNSLVANTLTAGSGINVTNGSGTISIALSNPTVQLANITDLTTDARNFLSSPSSSNLSTLVTDETGTGALVFANNPTMSGVSVSGNLTVANNLVLGGVTIDSTELGLIDNLTTGTVTANKVVTVDSNKDVSGFRNLSLTGNLTVSGSGLVASNINDFNTAVRTNRLDQMAAPTASVSMNSQSLTNLLDPVNAQDAATKAYVDAARSGLDVKQSVRVATTGNITLSGTQSIDGVSVVAGNRVLVKDQNTASQNGIYVVAAGAWSRASDADTDAEVTAGMFTFVEEGSTNADSGWVLTTNDTITVGSTSLAFAQFSGAGQITAGAGLTKNGNTIDVGTASSSRIVVNADSIDLATVTQSDGSGSSGVTFVQAVTRDSYGRVTGITTADVKDATTSIKGIASFDSSSFNVTSGAVSVKNAGISNSQLANNSMTFGSTTVALGGSTTRFDGLTAISGVSSASPTTLTFCVIDGGTP